MRLSKSTRERLEQELEHIALIVLPSLASQVIDAKSQGDLSQNSDYFVIADEERQTSQRLNEIKAALSADDTAKDTVEGVVAPGRRITIDFGVGAPETFIFGSVEEYWLGIDVMTPSSPLGSILFNREMGDEVTTPRGETLVVIAVDIV